MKKRLLVLIILFIPFFVFAQNEAAIVKDFAKKVRGISSFAFSNDVNIVSSNVDNQNTEMAAVNANMQVLWRTKIAGYILSSGKFKDKVFAIVSAEHSNFRGSSNYLVGYLINPANGSVVLQKDIYQGSKDYVERPHFFWAKDGSLLKMIVRQSAFTNKMHVGLPGPLVLISLNKMANDISATKAIAVLDFNEDLTPASIVTPAVRNGMLGEVSVNYAGDVFLAWGQKNGTIDIERYARNAQQSSGKVSVQLDLREREYDILERLLYLTPSTSNPSIMFGAIAHQNTAKDQQLSVFKADFKSGKGMMVTESLEKDAVKAIGKTYKGVNKKVDDPDLGWGDQTHVDYMEEDNDKLVVAVVKGFVTGGVTASGPNPGSSSSFTSKSPLVSIYNTDLKLQAHQLIPASFVVGTGFDMPAASYHMDGNKLYLIANAKTGMVEISGMFGVIDLTSGQWLRQEYLSKKHMANRSFISNGTMWFGQAAVACYTELSAGFGFIKMDCDLQKVSF